MSEPRKKLRLQPERKFKYRKSREAAVPFRLPAHRVGAGHQKSEQLKRLLDLLEEGLDLPETAIEFHDARGASLSCHVAGPGNSIQLFANSYGVAGSYSK
jgi:hypothetical protein